MKLSNMIQLYKIIKSGNNSDLKEYSKSMSPEEVKDLRVNHPVIFRIIRFIVNFLVRNKKHNLGNTKPTPKQFLASEDFSTYDLLDFNNKILETIPKWNALELDNITDKYFITLDYNTKTNELDGFEDALQWNCYLAASIKRIYFTTNDYDLLLIYEKLLKGINLCLIDEVNKKAIIRHPIKSIKKDLEPISQDMISGLTLLISQFSNNTPLFKLENEIKNKFNEIMDYHDYHLMYPDGRTNSYDLVPSLIYNHIKCFAYSSIRMSQGKFNKKDAMVLRDMIQTLIPEEKEPYQRSWYGLVVAVNFIDAMSNLYPLSDKEVNKIMDYQDFLHLALDWLRFYQKSTPEIHPELESVMHVIYERLGHKDGKKETSKRLCSILNLYPKFNLIEKTNENHEPVKGYKQEYALPPHYRHLDDYYWQRSAWRTGKDIEIHPSFEFTPVLARILPFNYYPEKKG